MPSGVPNPRPVFYGAAVCNSHQDSPQQIVQMSAKCARRVVGKHFSATRTACHVCLSQCHSICFQQLGQAVTTIDYSRLYNHDMLMLESNQ